jgi:hypothetical protein
MILLSQPFQGWVYRHELPYLACNLDIINKEIVSEAHFDMYDV